MPGRKTDLNQEAQTDESKPSGEDFELHGGGGGRGNIERQTTKTDEESSDDDFEAHMRDTV